jgi:hypothetical protein
MQFGLVFNTIHQPKRHLHHRGFEFLATNMRINSIGEPQMAFSHCRAGHYFDAVRIGITNVSKPSGAHGRTKLIAPSYQLIGQ